MSDEAADPAQVAVIVNPIAGVGGTLALHGSDGGLADRALRDGGRSHSEERMAAALQSLRRHSTRPLAFIAGDNVLGGNAVRSAELSVTATLPRATVGPQTSADDSRAAASAAAAHPVDLILFAGGDGTAADIAEAVGDSVPVLGVPSGVKMHSGVFAIDPERAGRIAARFLASAAPRPTRIADVVDVVVDQGPTRIGHAVVPHVAGIQNPKAPSSPGDAGVRALAQQLADEMEDDRLYLIGPGTSTGAVLEALTIAGSRNGVDAIINRRLIARDASETELLSLVDRHPQSTLIMGVVGGQGFLLGRGNQQLSAAVLRRVTADNLVVIAPHDKVATLQPPVLHVDLDEPARDLLPAFCSVRTSPTRSIVLRIDHNTRERGWAS